MLFWPLDRSGGRIRILLLDIETSPITAYTWTLFKPTIPITAIKDSSSVLCWSAKWLGSKTILFDSVYKSSKKKMLEGIHALLDEADLIIHYNGDEFDLPVLNKEFVSVEMPPPAPFKSVDLLKTVRRRFRFTSNKLDYISQSLGLGRKVEHTGFQLWVDCMNGVNKAWSLMERYNRGDVVLLEHLYNRLLPWIPNHPNVNVFDGVSGCPRCGSNKLQRRGTAITNTVTYQRYQCTSCGAWSRSSTKDNSSRKPAFHGIH